MDSGKKIDTEVVYKSTLFSNVSLYDPVLRPRYEALYEKERGNSFVKLKQWDEAIACYTNAINLDKTDAAYYANRGLCYLKKDNLHAAETDCTAALTLDPEYVKALLRRSTAREGLGSLRRAADDLNKLLTIEPHNKSVRQQLSALLARMGTKGKNFKSSPTTTPSEELNVVTIVENCSNKNFELKGPSTSDKPEDNNDHMIGRLMIEKLDPKKEKMSDLNIHSRAEDTIVQAVQKPPHLRSTKQLVRIPISEIPKGSLVTAISSETSANELTKTVVKHINKESLFKPNNTRINFCDTEVNVKPEDLDTNLNVTSVSNSNNSNQFNHMNGTRNNENEEEESVNVLYTEDYSNGVYTVPRSSIQFIADWRLLKGRDRERSSYLSAIPPLSIPSLFKNSMDSDIMSEILHTLHTGINFTKKEGFNKSLPYLTALTEVKRFSALAMFLSSTDQKVIRDILKRCREREGSSEEQIRDISKKYEI